MNENIEEKKEDPGGRFLKIIEKNYDTIKNKLILYHNLNEDILHTTIIKCYNSLNNNNLILKNEYEVKCYFMKSYKINILRDKLYFCNKPKEDIIDLEYPKYDDLLAKCQKSLLMEKAIDIFGEPLVFLFLDYIHSGKSLANFNKKYNIKNLKNKFKKIKTFVQKELEDFDLYKEICN